MSVARVPRSILEITTHRRYDQALTLRALGFKRLQQTVEHNDTPQIRGMVNKIVHLLKVEEIQA